MKIREAGAADLGSVLPLYTHLHGEAEPPPSEALSLLWANILADPNRHIILVEVDRVVAGSCEVLIVPNLTHGQRPYALIENVVTDADYRRRGCASAALNWAVNLARQEGCYKVMLMSGHHREGAATLYEACGFNSDDKVAYVQWLD